MKRLYLILMLLTVTACQTCQVVHECAYHTIQVGSEVEEMIACIGQPYCIEECEDGTRHYIYVQRLKINDDAHARREFVFVVDEDDVIADKWRDDEVHHDFFYENHRTNY